MVDKTTKGLTVAVTYLKMTSPPARKIRRSPKLNMQVELSKIEKPSVNFYRQIYAEVGLPWLWYERTEVPDEALLKIINHKKVAIYVLFVGGKPAGFAELDSRQPPNNNVRDLHLAYFGLMPKYTGCGLGTFFINSIVDIAWKDDIRRIWLRTCSLDHPAALHTYQKAGFVIYGRETCLIEDPRELNIIPYVSALR